MRYIALTFRFLTVFSTFSVSLLLLFRLGMMYLSKEASKIAWDFCFAANLRLAVAIS